MPRFYDFLGHIDNRLNLRGILTPKALSCPDAGEGFFVTEAHLWHPMTLTDD